MPNRAFLLVPRLGFANCIPGKRPARRPFQMQWFCHSNSHLNLLATGSQLFIVHPQEPFIYAIIPKGGDLSRFPSHPILSHVTHLYIASRKVLEPLLI